MGARVEQTDDGWRIPGGQQLHGAEIESFGDHRIAMAFAIAAVVSNYTARKSSPLATTALRWRSLSPPCGRREKP
jgi:5-enolpyruvylshikimate-3-phosphate synthase